MRDLYTVTGAQTITDELGNYVADEFGTYWADENVTTENVWQDEELVAAAFVHLGFTTDFYYSTLDVDIGHLGNLYRAGDLYFDTISFASNLSVDKATIRIENTSQAMSSMLLNNDQLTKPITISFGAVSTVRLQVYDLITVFKGELYGWTMDSVSASLNVAGLMARWNKKTLRKCQSSCPWPWQGTECAYSGTEGRCSQGWGSCKNQDNFGGFPHLPGLMEKVIY